MNGAFNERRARRRAIYGVCLFALGQSACLAETAVAPPIFGEGIKVGEVTANSAILWTRLCQSEIDRDSFALPGVAGEVRVLYGAVGEEQVATDWVAVRPERDFTCQLLLEDLHPGLRYAYKVEAKNDAGENSLSGFFRTAPSADSLREVVLVVTTGHKYSTDDEPGVGPRIYPAMQRLDPDLFVHTGDVVYYDGNAPPLAKTEAQARLHWHRLYSLPRRREFHRNVASYFLKDDHDILKNDCWPGQTYGELTFDRGVEIFREQNPSAAIPYRNLRWGRHLEIWFVEGREYRSANDLPDGPGKSIWGPRQLAWLREGLTRSTASFKVLISPTPIVGPDRTNGSKSDNHANAAFQHEGDAVRAFLAAQSHLYVACGDRHWQYVSVDRATGLREYSCGPSTDQHAGGWNEQNRLPEHRFLRVAGGFLSIAVTSPERAPQLVFRHHDVDGNVVHEEVQPDN